MNRVNWLWAGVASQNQQNLSLGIRNGIQHYDIGVFRRCTQILQRQLKWLKGSNALFTLSPTYRELHDPEFSVSLKLSLKLVAFLGVPDNSLVPTQTFVYSPEVDHLSPLDNEHFGT